MQLRVACCAHGAEILESSSAAELKLCRQHVLCRRTHQYLSSVRITDASLMMEISQSYAQRAILHTITTERTDPVPSHSMDDLRSIH